MTTITVNVTGHRQTGKSYVLDIINKALAEVGYEVLMSGTVTDPDNTPLRGETPHATTCDESSHVEKVSSHTWGECGFINNTPPPTLPKIQLVEVTG